MATLRVNATRMELLRLRRRTVLAKKGHKLLKDKLDGLIKHLLVIAKEHEKIFSSLESELSQVFEKLILANALADPKLLAKACQQTKATALLETNLVNYMGIKLPKYKLSAEVQPNLTTISRLPLELSLALKEFKDQLDKLVLLAQLNKALQTIARQITEIKRRVNALEYILIPELETSVRFIKMKLAEIERDNIVSLMKIKDIVRAR